MERVTSRHLKSHAGRTVVAAGWVHVIRALGNLTFIVIRDRDGLFQVVAEGHDDQVSALTIESVVRVTGKVALDERAPSGAEIRLSELEIVALAEQSLPFEVNKKDLLAGLDLVLDHRVLSLRHPKVHAIFSVQSEIMAGFRDFLSGRGFTEISTPKIVATGTEGGSELFALNYFDRPAYLAQSPQFYKQMLVGAGYERVFEVGHVYRAEEHNTSRHINEFTSLDLEMGFIDSDEDLMDLEDELLAHVFERVGWRCAPELELLEAKLPPAVKPARLPLAEVQGILAREYGKESPAEGLDPEGERLICEYMAVHGRGELVFVTTWPANKRPAYAYPDPDDPTLTRSFDLLFRGLEVTTGGQRIHLYPQLVESLTRFGLNPEGFASYLETFRLGMPPHGGLAIGLERLTARLLGLSNLREAALFPRDRTRLTP
ncbi:MAG TPA: aspartate--tRNA(Asn) ligase [Bacillota bacterium]|jgi:nondiscriminating aspartyl-tRNA synthetase